MSKENGSVPKGLRELSSEAIQKQVLLNENFEYHQVNISQFLRLYNGGSTDVELIRERAQRVVDSCEHLSKLLLPVVKPYLD